MNTRTLTAVFDDNASAERASRELAMKVAGVRGAIHSANDGRAGIHQLGIPEEDRSSFEEALRRGSVVLSAEIPTEALETAADVLEHCGAVDLDAREAEWRSQGWTGSMASTSAAATSGTATSGTATAGSATTGTARQATSGEQEAIPIVEERLRVGKREVSHGRVRIRSYVVETPVQEQVTLHQEHVQVERRPVDRPVAGSENLFCERTVEATETAEEAVVSKEARVTEEVVLRKTADDESRTISDTVRRTEVEVEDDRVNRAAGTTGTRSGSTPTRNPGR